MGQPVIHRVTELDLAFEPWDWPFARDNAAAISAHFRTERARKPALFNGKVLLMRDLQFSGSRVSARYFETDFASFLAWRDFGFPGEGVSNGFGMGALRGSDGVFLMGEMSAHTSNAGRIYFPSGTPEPDDLAGDRVDIAGSIKREVTEETGLTETDYAPVQEFHCVVMTPLVAIIQVLNLMAPAAVIKDRILANMARQDVPEFSAVHLVRDAGDIAPSTPRFVAAFVEAMT